MKRLLTFAVLCLASITAQAQLLVTAGPPSGDPVVDLSQLTTYTGVPVGAENASAYATIDFPNMAAGDSYSDPATSVTVWKMTDSSNPSGGPSTGLVPQYSTMGLQISPCWGTPCRNYTVWAVNPAGGSAYFIDFELGVGPSNWRTAPAGEARGAFARTEPGIFYYPSGTQLNRYDTATDALANTGSFPYSWTTDSAAWFHCAVDDSHCVAMSGSTANITVIALDDGTVSTQAFTGMDEPYMGGVDGDIQAFAGAGNPEECWNVTGDVVSSYTEPYTSNPFHTHVDRFNGENYIRHFDFEQAPNSPLANISLDTCAAEWPSSGNTMQSATSTTAVLDASEAWADDEINLLWIYTTGGTGSGQERAITDWDAATKTATISPAWTTTPDATTVYDLRTVLLGYPDDIHTSMHWQDASNTAPWSLWTNNTGGAFTDASWNTAVFFVNTFDGSKIHVGHTYNLSPSLIFTGSGGYWDEGHCSISPDGVLVMCGVNGNDNVRYDVAVWELPWN